MDVTKRIELIEKELDKIKENTVKLTNELKELQYSDKYDKVKTDELYERLEKHESIISKSAELIHNGVESLRKEIKSDIDKVEKKIMEISDTKINEHVFKCQAENKRKFWKVAGWLLTAAATFALGIYSEVVKKLLGLK